MPRISRFYGITIRMYHNEHLPPHFHAEYGGRKASVTLDGRVLRGRLPPRALRLVLQWTRIHRSELAKNWALARKGEDLVQIEPLA
jgi:hypothetical protein